jgi:hypothetical protein
LLERYIVVDRAAAQLWGALASGFGVPPGFKLGGEVAHETLVRSTNAENG